MSAAEILEGIRAWVEIESHTVDLAGIQAMVAEVEGAYRALGAATERQPGQDGYGDHLIARAPWNGRRPGYGPASAAAWLRPAGCLSRVSELSGASGRLIAGPAPAGARLAGARATLRPAP